MEQLDLFNRKKPRPKKHPQEWKLVSMRECPVPENLRHCDTPQKAAAYWRLHVQGHPFFNPQQECFAVVVLNTKMRFRAQFGVCRHAERVYGASAGGVSGRSDKRRVRGLAHA
jgi:hypothetical protein